MTRVKVDEKASAPRSKEVVADAGLARSKGKAELRGMSFDEGEKKLAPEQTKGAPKLDHQPDPKLRGAWELREAKDGLASRRHEPKYRSLSDNELTSLLLYSTSAYMVMNDVLRGTSSDEAEIAFWTPWCETATIALSKVSSVSDDELQHDAPTNVEGANIRDEGREAKQAKQDAKHAAKDAKFAKKGKLGKYAANLGKAGRNEKTERRARRARSQQGPREQIDAPHKANVPHVYRTMKLSAGYESTFKGYQAGGTHVEKGFLSTSTEPGTYAAKEGAGGHIINWRIWTPQGGTYLSDISLSPRNEQEVLFAPGQRLQITDLKFRWRSYGDMRGKPGVDREAESVSTPSARFTKDDHTHEAWNDRSHKIWEVEAQMLPPAQAPAPKPAKEDALGDQLDDVIASADDSLLKKGGKVG